MQHVHLSAVAILGTYPAYADGGVMRVSKNGIWSEYDNHGAISSAALDGSDPRSLASTSYSSHVAVMGDHLYWSTSSRKQTGALIHRLDLTMPDARPRILATGCDTLPSFALCSSQIAWIDPSADAVRALDPRTLA